MKITRFLQSLSLLSSLILVAAGVSEAQKPELVVQTGHTARLDSIAFSPDGNILASLSNDKTIKLWDVLNGVQLRTIKRDSEFGFRLGFNPDGTILISDSVSDSLQLWNVSTGALLHTLEGSVASTAFTRDGKTLAGISADTIKFWDVATGKLLRSFKSQPVSSIAFSPDGNVLAGGGANGIIRLWDASSGVELRTLEGIIPRGNPEFSATVERMPEVYYNVFGENGFWPADAERVGLQHAKAAAGYEFAVVHLGVKPPPGMHHFSIKEPVLYDSAGTQYPSFALQGLTLSRLSQHKISDLAFYVPQGTQLKSLKFEGYSLDLTTQILSVETTRPPRKSEDGAITSIAFSPDGKKLASAAFLVTKLWDVSSGAELAGLEGDSGSVTFSRNGKLLFTSSGYGQVVAWETATGAELAVLDASTIVFRPDGRFLGATIKGQDIQLRDLLTGVNLRTLHGDDNRVRAIALSPDGKTFASSGKDLKLWNMGGGGTVRNLKEAGGFVVAFSPDGKTVASGSSNINLWDVRSGTLIRSLSGNSVEENSSAISSIAFSADNKTLAVVTGQVELWNVSTGKRIRTIEVTNTEAICVAFSPDGKTIAIGVGLEGDEFFGIELWRVSTGKKLRAFAGHTASVQSVAFSPDGKTIASGSWDTTVRLWSVATGKQLRRLPRLFEGSVAFSPDGSILASDDDNTVRLWSVRTGRELRTLKGHFDSISSITFSANGKYVLSASRDSTVKLWEVRSGKELATLIALDEHDWLIVTPEGLFDGSPDAWNKILWRFNNNTFDHAPVEAFFNEFYYPDLLADVFAGKQLRAAADISRQDRRQPQLKLTLPDAQTTVTPATSDAGGNPTVREGANTAGGNATVRRAARNVIVSIEIGDAPPDSGHPGSRSGAQDVRLFRNGSLVKVWRGDVLEGKGSVTLEATLPIVAGENRLTAYAFNHDNIKSSDATLVVNGADSLKRKGTAYILAIGVNTYSNSQYNLNYAVPDAEDFSAELKRQQEQLKRYAQVQVVSLSNAQATKANITQKLTELAKQVQPEDAVIVYFAGHGTAQGDQFYLIPHDLGYTGARDSLDEAALKTILEHSISDRELEKLFEGIDAGKLLLVIDACNSGQALEAEEKRRGPMNSKGLAQLAYEKGMYVLTAAQSFQAALEAERLGHGFLTYALVESGLKQGAADREPKNGTIDIREWLNYATEEVPRMQKENSQRALSGKGRYVVFVGDGTRSRDATANAPVVDNIQRPRIFYRRELEANPLVIAVTKALSIQ